MGVQRAIECRFRRPPRWYGNLEGLWIDGEGRGGRWRDVLVYGRLRDEKER